MEFSHKPVMLYECMEGLNIHENGIYVDCTAGGGGHSMEIAKRLQGSGKLIALGRDPDAVKTATERLSVFGNAQVIRSNYSNADKVLEQLGIDGCDGILMDLGVSSYQLDNPERGFSYHNDAPLDMRMSREGISAYDIVNGWSKEQLSKIIYEYGEEKFAGRISDRITAVRSEQPIETTLQLAQVVKDAVPAAAKRVKNPCRKTFQAIRMAVNGELDHLSVGLDAAFNSLKKGGRLVVITFHSLEDRLVKQRFASYCKGCICPPDFPQCVCGRVPLGKLVNKKPITAAEKELEENSRSRSAKLRIIERR